MKAIVSLGCRLARRLLGGVIFLASIGLPAIALFPPSAFAVPSMARQTGIPCAGCHTVFPELTPFGRQFKLSGYTLSSADWDAKPWTQRLPIAGGLQVSRTSTENPPAGGTKAGGATPTDFPHDGKWIAQNAALYYGGKITDKSGALIQYNYDGIEGKWGMEMFDARYADTASVGSGSLIWGVTANNAPSVSDIYNSTPSWGFPHTGTAADQMPAATLIDMTLASKVGGMGVYTLWNDLFYAEVATYRTAKNGAFRFMSWGQRWDDPALSGSVLDSNAPYWRLALQKETGPHSFSVGTYGMTAKVFQDATNAALGTNRFRDIGYDANYQYIEGDHTASIRSTWINEKQDRNDAVLANGLASNASNTLKTLRVDLHYYYQRKWGGGLEYFRTTGTTDMLLYNTGDALMGSANGSPDARGYIAELNYLPVEYVKLALRFTRFQQFNGASNDYMPGRNASDNNTVYALAWLMF